MSAGTALADLLPRDLASAVGLVLVAVLVVLLLLKERLAGAPDEASRDVSRRLSLMLLPLLAVYCGYLLMRLVEAIR